MALFSDQDDIGISVIVAGIWALNYSVSIQLESVYDLVHLDVNVGQPWQRSRVTVPVIVCQFKPPLVRLRYSIRNLTKAQIPRTQF